MRRLRILLLTVGFLAVISLPAIAQTVGATTGAINGKVADATGGVMPGVAVTIASPSMQGTRTAVTDGEGTYRFPAIPPGDYKITYELAGFSTVVREGIRVGLGFTATVNIDLKVASLAESVTVSGASPVVDITSTKTATNFDAKELAALPNARDFWSILAAAPAVQMQRIDVGGSAAGTQTGYSTYDTKADQHRPMVEGIVNTEGTNAAGFYYDYGSFDEVSVATGTNTAEMPWPGVMTQFIAKSGGNTYHGKIYADYESGENPVAQHRRGADQAGSQSGRRAHRDRPESAAQVLRPQRRRRRLSEARQAVVVRVAAQAGRAVAAPEFPGQAVRDAVEQRLGQGDLRRHHQQQADWLRDVGQEAAAEPARHVPGRRDGSDPFQRRLDLESVLLGPHLQRRMGQRRQRSGVLRNPRRPVPLQVAEHPLHATLRPTRISTPTPSAAATATAGSTSRRAIRCSARSAISRTGGRGSHNFKIGGEIFDERFDYLRGQDGVGYVPGDVLHCCATAPPSEVLLFLSPTASLNGLRTTAPISRTRGEPGRG